MQENDRRFLEALAELELRSAATAATAHTSKALPAQDTEALLEAARQARRASESDDRR